MISSFVALVTRLVDVLVALLLEWHEAWRARHPLVVTREQRWFDIRQADRVCARIAAGTPVSDDVARQIRQRFLVLEIAEAEVVVRHMHVPTQAREFLSGIVRNQIERLSPWPISQTVYTFCAHANPDDLAALNVHILITSRDLIDNARSELEALGLAVDQIVVREPQADATVQLWSRIAISASANAKQARWLVVGAIAGWIGLTLGLSVWSLLSASAIETEGAEIAARTKTVQRQIAGTRTPQALATLPPAERAWIAKEMSPTAVVLLETLSRALPDPAYLTELHLDGTTVRLIGLASDAPGLLGPLERSGHLTDVHFFAPTTRGSDGVRFSFHIEGRFEPRLDIGGD